MTLPSSPPLSLSQIKAEFGGGNSFSQYYAGGSYVPSGTSGVNGAVPGSGTMAMSKFLGTTRFTGLSHSYDSGSGSETVPSGASGLTITAYGGGGGGGNGFDDGAGFQSMGGGGGSGARVIKTISISSGDWGASLSYSVDAAGDAAAFDTGASTVSGTLAAGTISVSAGGGHGGNDVGGPGDNGSGGAGGTASGGSSNQNGNAGANGIDGGAGGAGIDGIGGGGNGGFAGTGATAGHDGRIVFAWT